MTRFLTLVAALAALTLPAAAQARGTITYDGTTMTFTGDAAADHVSVGPSQGELSWSTSGLDAIPPQCTRAPSVDYIAYCPWPQRIVVMLGGGNDTFAVSGAAWDPFPASVDVASSGGDGDDRLQGGNRQEGGSGNDKLEGHEGDQILHGGPGDDTVSGLAGADHVYGDEGDDLVSGDGYKQASPDVIDGGPGVDAIDSEWVESEQRATAPVNVTLDGVADDGRPGERDNVVGVERLKVHAGGTFNGTDAADDYEIEPGQFRTPATVRGHGGNDRLVGDDDEETIDGGAGDDYIEGGFNNDTLIGGPGRDTVFADETGAYCNYWTYCMAPFGNDTIDVRDGEIDTVDCGVGTDTVQADTVDVLSSCETVTTAPAQPAGGGTPGPGLELSIARAKLGTALKRGLLVRVAVPAAGTVRVVAKRAATLVATRTATATRAGTTSVRLRFTKAGKRALRRSRTARLTISARFAQRGGATTTASRSLTLRR
jgi:hypothetical protein